MRKYLLSIGLLSLAILVSCKKEKTYQVKGLLLQSRSNPVPVMSMHLIVHQPGSAGAPIAAGTTSSLAEGKTDVAGFFNIKFKEGRGTFFGIPTSNKNAVTLSGTDLYGQSAVYIKNYPYNTTAPTETLYLYKKVDTLYIKSRVFSPVVSTDSFTIYATTRLGSLKKIKKGFTASTNSELLLDTIYQVVFPIYDYAARRYWNDISVYKTRKLLPLPNSVHGQDSLTVQDEKSMTLFYSVY